ncbi:hypothetical protein LSH36_131g00036 [Paralvinella palmiformis]|uniref:Polycomb protein VEFS-Box domain-containing protein n=1 Tax=Paralvinella palmiformis TaxID=53620 RepID=A0AAD9JX58_9ANNE|nr:hypothetical protein LSH36_131g00036 [Paralvinella palmiformis]
MKPRKRDHAVVDESKLEFERLQADHEMFLQAFESLGTVYSTSSHSLRRGGANFGSRLAFPPIFLQRSLSYMKGRIDVVKKRSKPRKNFKLDSLLAQTEAKHRKENTKCSYKSDFMNIAFLGYFHQNEPKVTNSEVQVALLKICHKKRKDVSSPVLQVDLGRVIVPINPAPELQPADNEQTLSIGSSNFNHNNSHSVKSYTLMFNVICQVDKAAEPQVNGLVNGEVNGEHNGKDDEPSPKHYCNHSTSPATRHSTQCISPRQRSCQSTNDLCTMSYTAELVVYDKYQRCLLTEGEYEIALHDMRQKVLSKKHATWETVMGGQAIGPFEVFNKCPTLKFKLAWSQLPLDQSASNGAETDMENDGENNRAIVPKHFIPRLAQLEKRAREAVSPSKRRRIFYQFLYNNNTRQQTEARDDLSCPWCSLPCMQLYSLLKHLRCCHPRFNFAYTEHPKGARIDVSINQCFDGAYVGNPQDLHSHIGYAFSRNGPVRRTPVTHLMVYRPKKPSYDIAEFMEPESEKHSMRQTVQGHNRLYYHTVTCQPIRPCEIETDSEDENDPMWLRQNTINMIDEFTDVNEGEKEVMKMWNIHVMHHNYIADCQMPAALCLFVEEYGTSLLQQNLVRNFLLHVINLYDFGLVRPEVVYRTVMHLLTLRNKLEADGLLPAPVGAGKCTASNVPWQGTRQHGDSNISFMSCPSFSSISKKDEPKP